MYVYSNVITVRNLCIYEDDLAFKYCIVILFSYRDCNF